TSPQWGHRSTSARLFPRRSARATCDRTLVADLKPQPTPFCQDVLEQAFREFSHQFPAPQFCAQYTEQLCHTPLRIRFKPLLAVLNVFVSRLSRPPIRAMRVGMAPRGAGIQAAHARHTKSSWTPISLRACRLFLICLNASRGFLASRSITPR